MKSDMQSSLANRLLQARKGAGLSTRSVAQKLKKRGFSVSHATIANYEKAMSSAPIELVVVLSELYGRPLNWFLEKGRTFEGVRYRSLPSKTKTADKNKYEAEAAGWLDAYIYLENKLEVKLSRSIRRFGQRKNERPEDLARRLRERLDLQPVSPVPSVVDVLEAFGVRVIEQWTEHRIDGFAAKYGDEYVVVLNPLASGDRSRMNAAHELAHVLMGDCDNDASQSTKEDEARAFSFASHFLLPNSQLKKAFEGRSFVRLVEYKERFGISLAGMVYRAEQLEFISKSTAKRLWIEFSKRGWKRSEPGAVRPERATRFEQLLDNALFDSRVTLRELASKAGTIVEAVENRLRLATCSNFYATERNEASVFKFPER